MNQHQVAARQPPPASDGQSRTLQWRGDDTEGDPDRTADDDDRSEGPRLKRRKTTRLSLKQRLSAGEVESGGSARVRLPTKHEDGAPKASNPRDAASGMGHATLVMGHASECGRKEVLTSFEAQLAIAKRKAREKLLVPGGRDQRQSDYNYARLGVVAVDLLFDSTGNCVVHGQCAREYLRVSHWWLAKLYNRAIEAAQVPVRRMDKSEVAASTNADMLISCIRRPSECLLSTLQFFKSCSMTYVFDIICPSAHGLIGKPSNRTKVAKQQKFSEFVRAHRSPTGRTADKHGRPHLAAFYLDAKWTVLRDPVNEDNSRLSFSSSFNAALVAAGLPIVHGDVLLRWLRLLLGFTKRNDGSIVPSNEHTTLYLHKTDACSTCLCLSAEIRSETQVLKRHLQHNDQATMDRHEAVQATRLVVTDLEGA